MNKPLFLVGCMAAFLLGIPPAAGKAPWFDNPACRSIQKINALSRIDRFRYGPDGEVGQNLWGTDTATCVLFLTICGDKIFKGKEINPKEGETCPPEYTWRPYAGQTVCCDEWKKAKRSNSPCNPLTDADCDGIANQEDTTPTQGGPAPEPPSPPEKGGKTLHADLRVIIQAPHRFPLGVTPFALVVKNYGPGNAPSVRLTGSAGLGELNYATTGQGNCTVSGTSLSCEFDSIPSGGSRSISVQLRTDTEGKARLTADVTGGAPDLVTENNHAEHNIAVKKATKGILINP